MIVTPKSERKRTPQEKDFIMESQIKLLREKCHDQEKCSMFLKREKTELSLYIKELEEDKNRLLNELTSKQRDLELKENIQEELALIVSLTYMF